GWEVPPEASDDALGQAVVDLLAPSGQVGAAPAEAREEETERLWCLYGLDGPTSRFARRVLTASVTHRHGRKSWVVQTLPYDPRERALSGEGQPSQRVRQPAGAAALGLALRTALDLPEPRRTRPST